MYKKYKPKADCFGYAKYRDGHACSALNDMLCVTHGKCPFYASRKEAAEKSKASRARAMEKGYYIGNGKYEPKGVE